jgi:alanine racemase
MESLYEYKNYAQIDLSALKDNYRLLSQMIAKDGSKAKPICVLKADGYGLGSVECARALSSVGADFFAVSDICEALEIREVCRKAKILIFGYTSPKNAPILIENSFIQSLHSLEYGRELASVIREAKAKGELPEDAKLSLHIKLDTGMGRMGFLAYEEETSASVEDICALTKEEELSLEGLYTHFAMADDMTSSESERQAERFKHANELLKKRGITLKTHISNSAGAIRYKALGCDYVRFGISLYGFPPSPEMAPIGVRPAIQLFCRIAQIKTLKKGRSVSYGGLYTAERDMRIATLSIGYADGLPRASTGASVIINGNRARIIGRVCMDQCMVELGDIEAREGDLVTVFDESGENTNEIAKTAGTIIYDIITGLRKRVHRKYKD